MGPPNKRTRVFFAMESTARKRPFGYRKELPIPVDEFFLKFGSDDDSE